MTSLADRVETKAKKEHRCDFCCEKIRIKEVYLKSTFVFDNSIQNWKTHKHCEKLAKRLKMYEDCQEGLGTDDFLEFVSDNYIKILSRQMIDKSNNYIITSELNKVPRRDKVWFLIRYFNQLDSTSKTI